MTGAAYRSPAEIEPASHISNVWERLDDVERAIFPMFDTESNDDNVDFSDAWLKIARIVARLSTLHADRSGYSANLLRCAAEAIDAFERLADNEDFLKKTPADDE